MDAVLSVGVPVHDVVGAEVGVTSDYYLSMFPFLAELEDQPLSCRRPRSRPLSGISSGGASPSGYVSPEAPYGDR